MNKMNFSAHVLNVFDEMKTSYEEVKNLTHGAPEAAASADCGGAVSGGAAEDRAPEL